ncbi:FKBP-type peptidyl-prolyl cis-trans isomerase [Modicisalibacter coralii]|uniref:FKBP-type peptidyl-prolyl cis-trans isomerase n=1 Tax=Modicisalibacter coralii TaxID=2304602 RepID=UPI00100B171A|nr:peptidylprolyl isomerase [Halomonas coralii]
MTIAAHRVVTLHYTLRDDAGEVLDDSRQRNTPLEYLHGHDNIVAGLERSLAGQAEGARLSVTLQPAEAYGLRDEALVQPVARSAFGGAETLAPGMRFQAQGPDGPRAVTILEVTDDRVTVDANHPLAGRALRYDVEILAIREATRAELAKGHPLPGDVEAAQVEDRKFG